MIPDFLTHYYSDQPFRSVTELTIQECAEVLQNIAARGPLPRRLQSEFYFKQRRRYEAVMHEQFVAKGGRPQRRVPHYAILGESEIWARIRPSALRIPLRELPSESVSFTYTDSFMNYVDRDLDGGRIRRKPQYGTLYRLEELEDLFVTHGWPGDRWKSEPDWEHDIYVEAQLWNDEHLLAFLPPSETPGL